jgi:hypothetical protein
MDHDPARKVARTGRAQNAAVCQHPAAPDPVRNRRIDDQKPKRREQQNEPKPDAFRESPKDQGRGDDCKGHLEREEQHFGQGALDRACVNSVQEGQRQPAPDP